VFDVVVIGGNLAGSLAAINAAENGVSVALVERHKKPFFPAHCGEAITDVTADLLNLDKMGCPKNEINEVIIKMSYYKEYHFKLSRNKIYIIDRNFLEHELLKKAKKSGVKLFLGKQVKKFNPPNEIILDDNEKIDGKVIIDASGIVCIIGKQIGVDTKLKPNDIGVCIQSRVQGHFEPNTIHMRFHEPYAPFGYTWLFPISEREANIGLGVPGGQKLDLKKLLDEYITHTIQGNYEITHTFRACEPLASPLNFLVKNNVMFVGDAARLVEPVTGAGIQNAVFSGILAGNIAAKYVLNEVSTLDVYQKAMGKKIRRIKKIYKQKNKLKTSEKYLKVISRVFAFLHFMNKIFPNFFQGSVAKTLKKDEKIIQKYKKIL